VLQLPAPRITTDRCECLWALLLTAAPFYAVHTGMDGSHPDVGAKPNIVTGSGACITKGSSKTCFAWNVDQRGHGTHVTGTIAALSNRCARAPLFRCSSRGLPGYTHPSGQSAAAIHVLGCNCKGLAVDSHVTNSTALAT
jgi:subtilisin family serine protease